MKKIDFHCHTTTKRLKNGYAGLEVIIEKMHEHGIRKSVLLASYFPHRGSGVSNFRLLDWIKDKKEFYLFGSLDFKNYFYQGVNELEELAEKRKLNGIKIYTSYQDIDLRSEKIDYVLDLASRYKIPVVFHCGYSYSSMREYGKPAITKFVRASDLEFLAQKYKKVNFVFSHLSKPFLVNLIKVVKRNKNIYSDMSGLIDSEYEKDEIPKCVEEIKRFLKECSSKKLLFGTDFPVQTHEDSITMIEGAMQDYSENERQDVYYNNARRLLKRQK